MWDGGLDVANVKLEGRIERWWFSSNLLFEMGDELCGDFYGLQELGFQEGEFSHISGVLRIDFVNEVCETEQAFIKLGQRQSINKVLEKMKAKTNS
jgi:hypothetical protein